MKQIKVYLYHEKDGSYSCYMDEYADVPYGLRGEGATVKEAMSDWDNCYKAMKEQFEKEDREFVEASFLFAMTSCVKSL